MPDNYNIIDALSKVFKNSQISIEVFAEFVETVSQTVDATSWGRFYYECIPAYFQGNKKAIETFINQGTPNIKATKMIANLLELHPRSKISNGDKKEQDMSADEKLLYKAFQKLWSIQKTEKIIQATAEGIKGKWRQTKSKDTEIKNMAATIASKWKTPRE